jgi:hypothetical protein
VRQARDKTEVNAALLEKSKTLLNMKVYIGTFLEARPYIEWREGKFAKPIYGNKVPCRVMVERNSDGLQICFQRTLLEKDGPSGAYYDLARQLADFFEAFKDTDLVPQVLNENNPQQIEELFTKHGIGPCEDEQTGCELIIELGSAQDSERTGLSSNSVGSHKYSSGRNTVDRAFRLAKDGRDGRGGRRRPSHPAINDRPLRAGRESIGSEPILQHEARAVLHSCLKRAKVDGIVPNVEVCTTSHETIHSRSAKQCVSRTQIQHRHEIVKLVVQSPDVGLQGEYFVHQMLKEILKDDFTTVNWTSELREYAHIDFSAWEPAPDEIDASDFTYFDHNKTLLNWLLNNAIPIPTLWQTNPLNFHIEVKSTAARSREVPFHLSRLQKQKAERMSSTKYITESTNSPNEILLVFRVYGLSIEDNIEDAEFRPGVQIYVDPGGCLRRGCSAVKLTDGWSSRHKESSSH